MAVTSEKECRVAYETFNHFPQLYNITIDFIPNKPKIEEIDNYGLPRSKRKFKPIDFPEVVPITQGKIIVGTRFKGMADEEEFEFLKKLYTYRTRGYWFFNGDRLEYITGDHWYYLNILTMPVKNEVRGVLSKKVGRPKFIDADRDFFYMWHKTELLKRIFGLIFVTSRRKGKTSKAVSILLNSASSTPEANCAIQAQKEGIAGSIFKRLVRVWQKIPQHEFLSPTHAGYDTPKKMLEFRKPSASSRKTQLRIYQEVLDSWIDYRATTASAYDSEGIFRYYIDEASKLENCDLNELFNVARETLSDGSSITGKMLMTSTAEDLSGKTLLPFEDMWKKSDYDKRNKIGQTDSGLIRYFQSAAYGYRHDADDDGELPPEFKEDTIDEFGYSKVELAEKIIRYFRESKSGNDLIQYKRKYPLTEEEAFAYGETFSPFNDEKLREHEVYNESIISKEARVVRGNFEWKNGMPDTEVTWIPNENGMWELYKMPKKDDRNKYEVGGMGRRPKRNLFSSSCDPYSHEEVVDKNRMSYAASHVIAEPSDIFRIPTVVCEYHGRRVNPNDFFEDMIKQCVFYSMPILIESQKQDCINYFKARGYRGFVMKDPYKESKVATDGISTRSDNVRNSLINNLAAYIEDYLGQQKDGNYFPFPFMRTLNDMRKFTQDKWTKNDLTVSMMILIASRIKMKFKKPKPKFKLRDFVSKFERGKTRKYR